MTEAEWMACDDPTTMNRGPGRKWWSPVEPLVHLDPRRKRLLAVACARLVIDRLTFPGVRGVLDEFEVHADGLSDPAALRGAQVAAERCLEDRDPNAPENGAGRCPDTYPPGCRAALLLREAGRIEPVGLYIPVGSRWGYWDWLGADGRRAAAGFVRDIVGNPFRPVAFSPDWRTDTAVTLARQAYESREFSAMPILADALQDAGCNSDDVLNHCRGPGPHVRGCWVVDLVLGKEYYPGSDAAGATGYRHLVAGAYHSHITPILENGA